MYIQSNFSQMSTANTQTSFKRISLQKYINRGSYIREQKKVQAQSSKIADVIGATEERVLKIIKGASEKRSVFFQKLVEHYNGRNFHLEKSQKENPEFIFNIYEMIDKPNEFHTNIIDRHQGSLETLEKIFELAQSKESLEYVQMLQRKVFGAEESDANKVIELLSSKHSEEYVKHADDYLSYLKLTKDNPRAIKDLDAMQDSGTYERKKYDAEYGFTKILKGAHVNFSEQFKQNFIQNYSKCGQKFLEVLIDKFYTYNREVMQDAEPSIMEMCNTTNKKNIGIRTDVIEQFMSFSYKNNDRQTNLDEIESLNKLFSKIDENEDVHTFVKKALKHNLKVNSVTDLVDIISVTPIKKASIFIENIEHALGLSKGSERADIIAKHIEDPFYIPESVRFNYENSIRYGFRRKEGNLAKMVKRIHNKLNMYRYSRVKDQDQIINIKGEIGVKAVKGVNETKEVNIQDELKQNHVIETKPEVKPDVSTQEIKPELQHETSKPEVKTVLQQETPKPEVKPESIQESPKPEAKPELQENNTKAELIQEPQKPKTNPKLQKEPPKPEPKSEPQKAEALVHKPIMPNVHTVQSQMTIKNKLNKQTAMNTKEFKMYQYLRQQMGDKINKDNKDLVIFMIKQQDKTGKNMFKANDIISLINKEEGYLKKQKRVNYRYDTASYYKELLDMMKEEYATVK